VETAPDHFLRWGAGYLAPPRSGKDAEALAGAGSESRAGGGRGDRGPSGGLGEGEGGQGSPCEFESECPGYWGAQDTFYVGTLNRVGRIYQQTFIDAYSKVGFAKLYDRKTALTAADLLNDRALPFFQQQAILLSRVLTDRGTEYWGGPERHEHELLLVVETIDHTRTKTKSPQPNGICERFHKTLLNEFNQVAFRKKSMPRWWSCKRIWMRGSIPTITIDHTKGAGVMGRRSCRRLWTVCL